MNGGVSGAPSAHTHVARLFGDAGGDGRGGKVEVGPVANDFIDEQQACALSLCKR